MYKRQLFGVALEITLRLLPKPERYRTVLAAYASLAGAGDAVAQVVASGLLPGAMEIMDALAIEAAEAAVHAGYPRDAAALLIVEPVSYTHLDVYKRQLFIRAELGLTENGTVSVAHFIFL